MDLAIVGAILGWWIATIAAWIDGARFPFAAWSRVGRSKVGWFVLLFLGGWVAAIYYFVAVRKGLVKARRKLTPREVARRAEPIERISPKDVPKRVEDWGDPWAAD